jgi:hypothetical protein
LYQVIQKAINNHTKNLIIMTNLNLNDKVKLNDNGTIRIYEVKEIRNNEYKLFNKFKVSFFASLEYIKANLVD